MIFGVPASTEKHAREISRKPCVKYNFCNFGSFFTQEYRKLTTTRCFVGASWEWICLQYDFTDRKGTLEHYRAEFFFKFNNDYPKFAFFWALYCWPPPYFPWELHGDEYVQIIKIVYKKNFNRPFWRNLPITAENGNIWLFWHTLGPKQQKMPF